MRRWRRMVWSGALCAAGLALLLAVWLIVQLLSSAPRRIGLEPIEPFDGTGLRTAPPDGRVPEISRIPLEYVLQRGETLSDVLGDLGFGPAEAYELATRLADHLDVRRLQAGKPYLAYYSTHDARLAALEWPVEDEGRVVVEREAGRWHVSLVPYERRVAVRSIAGRLDGVRDALWHLTLPALTLGYGAVGIVTRMMRSSLLEAMGKDYADAARARGLPERLVVRRHARRTAFIPTITVIVLSIGIMFEAPVTYGWKAG